MARLEAYAALLMRWQPRINLVANATLGDLWHRHFLDSAQLLPLLPAGAASLVDLGSGAGFPGLVLAILGAAGVELVEADARKCAFLREAARITQTDVTIHNARIDSLPARPFAVVAARGVAPLDRLLPLAARFIGPATLCLFPKGKEARQEVDAAEKTWSMDVASHPSRTDKRGTILCLSRVQHR